MELSPALVLAMWSGGVAGGGALVAAWRIVGPGFGWLVASVVVLFGSAAAAAGGGALAWMGVVAALIGGIGARWPRVATAAFAVATAAFLGFGIDEAPGIAVVAGAIVLGGITSEMMLGHWYLVDPRLPRWSLRALAAVGASGLAVEVAYVLSGDELGNAGSALGWSFAALAVMTALLLAGVWFALREPRYSGVMAATGLSYLATLTAFGVVVLGGQLRLG